MNIWLVMSGEPLEMFGERPHRVGVLSKMLVARGHSVTWWTTDYDHQHKKYFYNEDKEILNHLGVNMIFLHPNTPYKKNISIQRIINYKQVAKKFEQISKTKSKPDIILSAFPSIDLAYSVVKYAKDNKLPVVIDARDMWPDIFLEIAPTVLKPLMALFLKPMYSDTRYIFKNTDAITAMTDEFIKFGLNYGDRNRTKFEKSFPFGYPAFILTKDDEESANIKFQEYGIDYNKFIITYFGTIGKQFNFQPVIEAANKLKNYDIQFILCGVGDNFQKLKIETTNLDNIILPGWVNQSEIWTLMKNSKASLAPYINKKDFLASIPNKAIEYLAGGLPILSSIDGVLGTILRKNNCGFIYGESSNLLYKNILELKNNDKLLFEMSYNAENLFNNKFSAKKVYSEMIEYLEMIEKEYENV